jgi:hypothetical protein
MTMPAIFITDLYYHQPLPKVTVHSIDMALYQVSVMIDGFEFYVKENNGEYLRARSPVEVQKRLDGIEYVQMVLRHESAYDEMVGQPTRQGSNALEVPFGRNRLY